MNELIENLINGNNSTAKRQAGEWENWDLREAMLEKGWSLEKATLASDWLKGRDCYQAYCDAD